LFTIANPDFKQTAVYVKVYGDAQHKQKKRTTKCSNKSLLAVDNQQKNDICSTGMLFVGKSGIN
jgi:hypothetical protein